LLCVVWCVASAREYRGLRSLTICSSIKNCCCCCCNNCMCSDSQQFMILPFSHICNNCRVSSGLSYSYLLMRIWVA
jgi:hypothetical protein